VSRHRPSRTHLLLGLVVVLLATIPVVIPLVVFRGDEPHPGEVRLASGPGEGTMPEAAPVPGPGTIGRTTPPPAAAGPLVPTTSRPATPSPTAETTTPTPPPPATTSAASPTPAAPDPTTAEPTSASPTTGATVLDAAANLVVADVSWTPQPSDAGQQVVFSAVVRNTGAAATPALPTGVAFSVDGSVVSWSGSDSTPLGPGEQRTFTADDGVAGAAWTATDGDHAVAATVDDTGQIPELNEDDNTATAQLDVP
jgi:CARDB